MTVEAVFSSSQSSKQATWHPLQDPLQMCREDILVQHYIPVEEKFIEDKLVERTGSKTVFTFSDLYSWALFSFLTTILFEDQRRDNYCTLHMPAICFTPTLCQPYSAFHFWTQQDSTNRLEV